MPLVPGTHHGPYEILAQIGAGGMGEVYKALDTRLNRPVALKVLPADIAQLTTDLAGKWRWEKNRTPDPERRRRFVQEAQIASALQHPNIVTIYEINLYSGVDTISMELVRGRSLDAVIPRKGLRLGETLKYAVQIADALAAAHAAGVVHRDLKPGNVMITDEGVVKVLDFGLAKLTEPDPEPAAAVDPDATRTELAEVKTEDGTIRGSVAYMSPEQAEGKKVDARSDIFSFGAILYEMLTGQRAFQGDSKMSTLAAVLNLEPKPLSPAVEGLPRELERLVARCLSKDLAKRSQHMADVRLALEGLKEDAESGSLETGAATAVKRAKSRVWPAVAMAACVALLSAAAFVGWRSAVPEAYFEPGPLTTLPGSENSPSFSPDGSQVTFTWPGEQPNTPLNIYVKLIGGGPPLRLTTDGGVHSSPAWSPDGKSIAYWARHTDGRQGIFLVPPLGGPERLLAEDLAEGRIDWSPDGKWIAHSPPAAGITGIILISVETGERIDLAKLNPALATGNDAAFSPDGRRLAYIGSRGVYTGDIYLLELSAEMKPQGEPKRITFGDHAVRSPAWTADGREIVFMDGSETSKGSIARIAPDGKGRSRRIPGLGYAAGPIAISRSGRRMAFARGGIDGDILRLDLSGREAPQKLAASTRYDAGAAYSPDGKRIAFSSNRSGPREIWVCDADGTNAVQLTHFDGPVTGAPRWSPDGRRIAFDSRPGDNADIFVIGAEGGAQRRLTYQRGEDARPAWSPDGKWIYFSSDQSGPQEIWRMAPDGSQQLQITKTGGHSAIASTDGQWLYYQNFDGPYGPLRKIRGDGGGETEAIPLSVGRLGYTATPAGVYFVSRSGEDRFSLQMFRFATGTAGELAKLDYVPGVGLSVSPDGRYVLLTKLDQRGTDLMLVENFH
jgi:Tol biopolymer transport system component/serine/threonine protein kinase